MATIALVVAFLATCGGYRAHRRQKQEEVEFKGKIMIMLLFLVF